MSLKVFAAIWVLLIAPKSVQERREEFSNKGVGKAGGCDRWEMPFLCLCLPGAEPGQAGMGPTVPSRTWEGAGGKHGPQEWENLTCVSPAVTLEEKWTLLIRREEKEVGVHRTCSLSLGLHGSSWSRCILLFLEQNVDSEINLSFLCQN